VYVTFLEVVILDSGIFFFRVMLCQGWDLLWARWVGWVFLMEGRCVCMWRGLNSREVFTVGI
jgi:hypothetical protein